MYCKCARQATPFVKFLLDWRSSAPTLDERIRNLAEGLAAAGRGPLPSSLPPKRAIEGGTSQTPFRSNRA